MWRRAIIAHHATKQLQPHTPAVALPCRRPQRWKQHRSSRRYLRHLFGGGLRLVDTDAGVTSAFDLPSKVRGLAGPLLYVLAIACLVAAYETLAEVRGARPAPPEQAPAAAAARCSLRVPSAPQKTGTGPLQAGKVPVSPWLQLGNSAPFQLSSFALSLLLVFRRRACAQHSLGGMRTAQAA